MHIRPATGEFRFDEQYRPPRSPQLCMLLAVVLGIGFAAILCLGGYAVAADKGVTYEQGRADRQALEAGLPGWLAISAPAPIFGPSIAAPASRRPARGKAVAGISSRGAPRQSNGSIRPISGAKPNPPIATAGIARCRRKTLPLRPRLNSRSRTTAICRARDPRATAACSAWLTYWPVLAGVIGVAAVLGWLGLNLPGARRVKMAWGRVWTPVRPALSRMAHAIRRHRGKIWTLSLIAAAVFEIVRQTVPGQSRVWSASYTAEAISLLIAALLTITAMPGIIGMFFKPVTWQIVGWTFRMVWPNLYQFGRIGFSAFVCYLFQFGWLSRFDPLGHFQATIRSAGDRGHRRCCAPEDPGS